MANSNPPTQQPPNQEEAKEQTDKLNSLKRTPSNRTTASKTSDEASTIYYSLPPSPKEDHSPQDNWTPLSADPYLTTSPRAPSPASNTSSIITVIWAPVKTPPQETQPPDAINRSLNVELDIPTTGQSVDTESPTTSINPFDLARPSAPSPHRDISSSPLLHSPPPPNSPTSDTISISSSLHALDASTYHPLPSSPSGRYGITPSMIPLLPSSISHLDLTLHPPTQTPMPTPAPTPATASKTTKVKELHRNIWGVLYGRKTRFTIEKDQREPEEKERLAANMLRAGKEGQSLVLAPEEEKRKKKNRWRKIRVWFKTHLYPCRDDVSHAGVSTKLP